MSVPRTLTDVALVLFPIPYLMRLNTKTEQKVVLAGLFILGGL